MLKKIIILILGVFCLCGISLADIEKVQTLLVNGDLTAAEKHCRELLGGNPTKTVQEQALFYLATINLKQGKYADCRHNFNLLIRDFPGSRFLNRARLGIADSYLFEENYSLAEKIYVELLAGRDESIAPTVYCRLIDLKVKAGDRDKAQDYLTQLHSKYPLSFEAGLIRRLPEAKATVSLLPETKTSQEIFTPLETGHQRRPSGVSAPLETKGQSLTGFTVQVGAFADHPKADRLCRELIALGEDAYIELLETPVGQSLYRVRVGKLSSSQEAEALAKKLASQGYPTKIIP